MAGLSINGRIVKNTANCHGVTSHRTAWVSVNNPARRENLNWRILDNTGQLSTIPPYEVTSGGGGGDGGGGGGGGI